MCSLCFCFSNKICAIQFACKINTQIIPILDDNIYMHYSYSNLTMDKVRDYTPTMPHTGNWLILTKWTIFGKCLILIYSSLRLLSVVTLREDFDSNHSYWCIHHTQTWVHDVRGMQEDRVCPNLSHSTRFVWVVVGYTLYAGYLVLANASLYHTNTVLTSYWW